MWRLEPHLRAIKLSHKNHFLHVVEIMCEWPHTTLLREEERENFFVNVRPENSCSCTTASSMCQMGKWGFDATSHWDRDASAWKTPDRQEPKSHSGYNAIFNNKKKTHRQRWAYLHIIQRHLSKSLLFVMLPKAALCAKQHSIEQETLTPNSSFSHFKKSHGLR